MHQAQNRADEAAQKAENEKAESCADAKAKADNCG